MWKLVKFLLGFQMGLIITYTAVLVAVFSSLETLSIFKIGLFLSIAYGIYIMIKKEDI